MPSLRHLNLADGWQDLIEPGVESLAEPGETRPPGAVVGPQEKHQLLLGVKLDDELPALLRDQQASYGFSVLNVLNELNRVRIGGD